MQTTPKAILEDIHSRLKANYDINEVESLSKILLEDIAGIQRHQIPLNPKVELTDETKSTLSAAINRLLANEPIQYITGKAYFYGHEFKVAPGVLIPRPETEELVDLIVRKHKQQKNLAIADIGCGSGCIAISLGVALPNSSITAIDISETALALTSENAEGNKVSINTIHLDILTETLPTSTFDIIVSNPPYITNKERELMHANVLDHEPELALFVPNEQPLKFYEAIAQQGHHALKSQGWIYCEINEHFGSESVELFKNYGYHEVLLYKDMQGKDRMISCQLG